LTEIYEEHKHTFEYKTYVLNIRHSTGLLNIIGENINTFTIPGVVTFNKTTTVKLYWHYDTQCT